MKLIIAGSRSFDDYVLMAEALRPYLGQVTTVISGTARGADSLGEEWAKLYEIPIIRMPAEWDKFGKSAGYRRNCEMAKIADQAHVFWDRKSRGTRHMIDIMKLCNKPVTITYFRD